jgi:hypothetical protein
MSNFKGALVPAQYVQAFGPAAGILLGQIAYWHTKASGGQNSYIVKRWGHRWLARSRDQLRLETGLSASQLKSALKALSTQQIIVVEQHLFGNKNISHIRLGPDGHNWVGAEQPPEIANKSHPEMAETANSISNKTIIETKKDFGVPCTQASSGKKEKEKGKQKKTGGSQMADPVDLPEPVSASQLEQVYRIAFEEAYKEQYLPPFGLKELGQISLLAAKCPPDTAQAVIDYAVRNWYLVSNVAASHQAAYNIPALPTVGFMLSMVQSMVNAYLEAKKPPKSKTIKPLKSSKPPVSSPPTATVVDPDDLPVTDPDVVYEIFWGQAD